MKQHVQRTLALYIVLMLAPSTALNAAEPASITKPAKPNIIVILAEDLGYGDLGCFGQKTLKTPRLDAMTKEGMRLSQFYAGNSLSAPSRCTLLTGKHTGRAVVRGDTALPSMIPPDQAAVASLLKGAGYATACIGKWGVGTPDKLTNPNDVGFEHFFGCVNAWHARNPYPEFLIRNGKVVPLKNEVGAEWKKWQDPKLPQGGQAVAVKKAEYAPDLLVDDAIRFIRENEKKSFFLLLALNAPQAKGENEGIDVPELGEFAANDWPRPEKAFAAMVRNIDRDTGRILDLLKELKLDQNTLVIFTSANGPNPESGHRPEFFQSTGKYRGVKGDPHEGGIRVPTIAWWPGTVSPGSEDTLQWYAGDLMATAAELSGATLPAGCDSDSLLPALRGQSGDDKWRRKSPLYWESYQGGTWQVVRFGKWKAIRSPIFSGEILLFDMSNDHAEKHNYAIRRPDLARHANYLLIKNHQPDPNWKKPMP